MRDSIPTLGLKPSAFSATGCPGLLESQGSCLHCTTDCQLYDNERKKVARELLSCPRHCHFQDCCVEHSYTRRKVFGAGGERTDSPASESRRSPRSENLWISFREFYFCHFLLRRQLYRLVS